MAKSKDLFLTRNHNLKGVTFVNADAALTLKTLYTASADDAIVKSINVTNSDATARVVDVLVNDTVTDYLLGSVSIPTASGTNGTTTSVDLLSGDLLRGLPFDALGKRVLPLKGGYLLKVRNQTQQAAATTMTVLAMIEEY